MIKIFVLASGRTGTKYLSELFKLNINRCISKHEPDPDMFGPPIWWYFYGEKDKIIKLFEKKKKKIERYNSLNILKDVYIETNHAFLKSFCDVAIETFPDLKLIHLIRSPLEVAKSQFNRGSWIGEPHQLKGPAKYWYIDSNGKKYNRWHITGKEEIFQVFNFELSRYQKLLVQWIELENRAMNFLERYNKYNDCYTLEMSKDLNNEKKIKDMFSFFNLKTKINIDFKGEKNKGVKPTIIESEDIRQLKEIVNNIPDRYLKIFKNKPYTEYKWNKMLLN